MRENSYKDDLESLRNPDRFSRMPSEVLLDHALSTSSCRVYGLLALLCRNGPSVAISHTTIAVFLKMHRLTVMKSLKSLVKAQHLKQKGHTSKKVYILNSPLFKFTEGKDSKRVVNNSPKSQMVPVWMSEETRIYLANLCEGMEEKDTDVVAYALKKLYECRVEEDDIRDEA